MTDINPRDRILKIAAYLAGKQGYQELSRSQIARACELSDATISFHFGDMDGFRDALMRYAIENKQYSIVAQGLANKHIAALAASRPVKLRAIKYLRESSDGIS